MGRLYTRNGRFWGDYQTPEGKRIQRSLRTKDKQVAKQRLRDAELAATTSPRGRRQRLSEAIDYMITATLHDRAEDTREMYRQKGRRIATTLGDPYIHDITLDMLSGYIGKRLDKDSPDAKAHGNAKPHTVAKELITIRRALKVAKRRGILRVMPEMPEFSAKYRPKDTWLTPEQFELLVAEFPPDRQRWLSLAALAGCNSSEVESVEWETTDLAANKLLIQGTKRESRRRWVPIAPALRVRLEAVDEKQRHGKVVEHWGNVRRDLHAAVERANTKIMTAAIEAGLDTWVEMPKVSPNDLRRTFASWLVQNGVQLLTVATLMGHSSTRMVERVYGKLSKANLEDAIARLPQPKKEDE